jgi:hypothetical protein
MQDEVWIIEFRRRGSQVDIWIADEALHPLHDELMSKNTARFLDTHSKQFEYRSESYVRADEPRKVTP